MTYLKLLQVLDLMYLAKVTTAVDRGFRNPMLHQKINELLLFILDGFVYLLQEGFSSGDSISQLLDWYIVSLRDADITI
jgi:hypothetical protein